MKYKYKLKGNWWDNICYLNYWKNEDKVFINDCETDCETITEFTPIEFINLSIKFGFDPNSFERFDANLVEKLEDIKGYFYIEGNEEYEKTINEVIDVLKEKVL